jgi:pimeloyl-ACP methyl ester carboxylesterase
MHLPALETIPNIEIVRLPGAGHMLMHCEPQACIEVIAKLDAAIRVH